MAGKNPQTKYAEGRPFVKSAPGRIRGKSQAKDILRCDLRAPAKAGARGPKDRNQDRSGNVDAKSSLRHAHATVRS